MDSAELALRNWLAPGRHRPGDRLPPEHDLASMLGVSRGTLRVALERLERSGEIVRRQGSGTFVADVTQPAAFNEGLERLVSYTKLARRRGVRLGVAELTLRREPLVPDLIRAFALDAPSDALHIRRTLTADGVPAAIMEDTIHPDAPLPTERRLRRALERGDMVLDVLLASDVPIAFASTSVRPRLLTARDPAGRALGVARPTATLELLATYHVTRGEAMQVSRDLFAPDRIDLHVMRWLDASGPAQVH